MSPLSLLPPGLNKENIKNVWISLEVKVKAKEAYKKIYKLSPVSKAVHIDTA